MSDSQGPSKLAYIYDFGYKRLISFFDCGSAAKLNLTLRRILSCVSALQPGKWPGQRQSNLTSIAGRPWASQDG